MHIHIQIYLLCVLVHSCACTFIVICHKETADHTEKYQIPKDMKKHTKLPHRGRSAGSSQPDEVTNIFVAIPGNLGLIPLLLFPSPSNMILRSKQSGKKGKIYIILFTLPLLYPLSPPLWSFLRTHLRLSLCLYGSTPLRTRPLDCHQLISGT